jgi:hypothetical protein
MKRVSIHTVCALALSLGLGGLIGCGGSSSSGGSSQGASISSFEAADLTITVGSSTNLMGYFANGTGVITPGNIPETDGVAVSVSPTTTTTYTLTVTPASGTAVTQTVTVTVDPLPSITSFVATPAAIPAGGSANLTAVFANGTGVITPGSLNVTSGTAVSVSPMATTTYTLTVTPPTGTAITQTVTVTFLSLITVNQSSLGPAVTDQILGVNMGYWYDQSTPGIVLAFQAAGIRALRWPGGSASDVYHWANNYQCDGVPLAPSYWVPAGNQFPEPLISEEIAPANLDVALTANYGTDEACTGPGDPTEAAAWAANALANGNYVSHITVGNEEYGAWETDLHTIPNDAATYAAATKNGYYPDIKAANPNVLVGVSVNPGNTPVWDPIVLANAPYDFVEYHYYPEAPGSESDSFITQQAAQELTQNINIIKAELATAGKPDTPIYVGEIGGPYTSPGKQSWSITQGLYAGQVLGEMMNDGVSRLTWWIGFGNCDSQYGNDSSSVYGWQNFGAYNIFSDGPSDPTGNCPGAGPMGTMSPTARAFQLLSSVAINGEHALTASVSGDTNDVRAYAATNPNGGTALVLFNLNETTSETVAVTLSGQTTASTVTVESYDKAIYDQTNAATPVWAPPTTSTISSPTLPLTLTLTPWSMNVVILH